ncbi:unnamed protein product [Candida verbasci]|uniref:UPF3 domain-containing protein n=1 Tax=Candida verbasci TaxID=1227364 RepID=A0A9W4X984_9ASCO|nr:unnamed protein product [Candida verbasci]
MASIAPRRSQPANASSRKQSTSNLSGGTTSNIQASKYNKIIIRLLPPSLSESEFLNQIANYYPYHASKITHFYYKQGSYPLKPFELPVYSRTYLNFNNSNDLQEFQNFVKNKPFQDEKDSIVPIIEKALFHKMVDSRSKNYNKKENKEENVKDKLDENPFYLKFLKYLNNEIEEFALLKVNNIKSKNKKIPGTGDEKITKREEARKKFKEEQKKKKREKRKAKRDEEKKSNHKSGKDNKETKEKGKKGPKNKEGKEGKEKIKYLKSIDTRPKRDSQSSSESSIPTSSDSIECFVIIKMEKNNILLPFAFSSINNDNNDILDTSPRDKITIDQNANSRFHTRNSSSKAPVLNFKPRLKRKMGESFNDKDQIKKPDIGEEMEEEEEEEEEVDGDENTHNDTVIDQLPSSPFTNYDSALPEIDLKPTNFLLNEVKSSPRKILSSEPDFGIDKFNRFKGSSFNETFKTTQPSSVSSTMMDINDDEILKELSYNEARRIIINSFEDIDPVIHLESMNLYELPTEIKDLNNLVVFGNSESEDMKYQLYLTNNKLKFLPPALFKFTKLQVLSLRQNELKSLPPTINKLENLCDFYLSNNRIKFLPWQLLQLNQLENFVAGPNPYLCPPNDVISIGKDFNNSKLLSRSHIKYLSSSTTYLTSLKCLCLNKIAKHDVTYQETKAWKKWTPKLYHNLIIDAIMKGKYNDTCNQCNTIVVEPVAEVFEWWNILQNKNIPIRKQFCCKNCVDLYLKNI